MNFKQAQAVLSDFLMKCADEGVALPDDPLDAVIAAVRALDHEAKHEVGRPQIEAAMAHLRRQFGVVKRVSESSGGGSDESDDVKPVRQYMIKRPVKKERKQPPASAKKASGASGESNPSSPTPSKQRERKVKLHDDVLATPAKRHENQPLVEQLVELGQYEMAHGHSQRGVARLRAAKEVRDALEVITSGAQARKLDRVGPSAAAKVDAILHSGLKGAMREYQE